MPLWALIVVAIAVVHGNSLHSPFHFDDFHSIVDNAWLRSLAHVPRYFTDVAAFSPLEENRAYRPILLVGFAISHALGGGEPWGYHVVTLILHAIGAACVAAIAHRSLRAAGTEERWARGLGLLAGLVMAVHPLVTEPVSYVSSRSSLQAAVLCWLTLWAWIRFREEDRRRFLALAMLFLLLAMATKIIAMTAPVLIAAYELLLRRPARGWIRPLIPLVAVAVLFTVAHELVVGEASRAGRSTVPPLHYLLTETEVWLRFIGLFAWPEDLSADLTMPWRTTWWEGPVARAILLNAAIVLGALALRRRAPVVTLGVLWFYVALAPTNSIVPLSEPASEHRVYIALPGLVLVVVGALAQVARAPHRQALAIALSALWIVGLGAAAHARNRVWQSELALWSDVVRRSPDNGRAHLNLGLAQMARGDRRAARQSFDRCAEAWPRYAFCWINHAALALEERRLDDAERNIAIAERLLPSNVYVRLWRGHVERALERWPSAEAAYRATLAVAPGHTGALQGVAFALFMQSRIDEAMAIYAGLDPLDADGHFARGFVADRAQDVQGAQAAYRAALAVDPRHARASYNLAVSLHRSGDLLGAIALYEALRARRDATPDALYNLASALWQVGQADRAREIRGELVVAAPDYPGLTALVF